METLERVKYRVAVVNPNTWSGITMYSGATYKVGAMADRNGSPITGLTEDDGKTKGTRRVLEAELGMEEDYLRKGNTYARNPFWHSFNVPISASGMELNGEDPMDYLKICFLAAQPNCAVGYANIKSKTEFVIFSPEKAAKKNNEGRKVRRKAQAMLHDASLETRKNLMFIYGVNPATMNEDDIDIFLDDQIYVDPAKFASLIGDDNIDKKSFILKCVSKHILTNSNGMIKKGENVLGNTVPEAVAFLFSKKNEKALAALKTELDNK